MRETTKHDEIDNEQSKRSEFQVSSLCGNGTCVGVKQEDNAVIVADLKNVYGEQLTFTKDEWTAFIGGVKKGEFDIV